MRTITQAEYLNQSFIEAKSAIIEIHKEAQVDKGRVKQIVYLCNAKVWAIRLYNPKSHKIIEHFDFNSKESAERYF